MGLWYFAAVDDQQFHTGLEQTDTGKLRGIHEYLQGLQASGFHLGDRAQAVGKEIRRRRDEAVKLHYGR